MVQLHTMVMEDGSMKMQEVPEIAIPAGGQVVLQPKDLHVMLMDFSRTSIEGKVRSSPDLAVFARPARRPSK